VFFVATPLIELYFMIQVGSVIGALPTIALSLLTAVIGGYLVREQGLSVAFRARELMNQGVAPAFEIFDGVLLLIAGFALLLPGFVTDLLGFLLLIPPVRHRLIRRNLVVEPSGAMDPQARIRQYLDVEYRREDER
jgi:UPF0716 protein FxsA